MQPPHSLRTRRFLRARRDWQSQAYSLIWVVSARPWPQSKQEARNVRIAAPIVASGAVPQDLGARTRVRNAALALAARAHRCRARHSRDIRLPAGARLLDDP